MKARLLLVVLALLLGLQVGTQVQAWEFRYHPSLGRGVPVGVHRLYAPWQGLGWAWRWYGQAPQRFTVAGHYPAAAPGTDSTDDGLRHGTVDDAA
jgi:hypothetical protein